MSISVFILAGGSGIRLWPLSSIEEPKQFLPLFPDGSTFFMKALSRAKKITEISDIFVLTTESCIQHIRSQAPELPYENIFTESERKNTAPVISVAMMKAQKKYGDVTAVVIPSDHLIPDENSFAETVLYAAECAERTQATVTVGLTPTRPTVCYGYIKCPSDSTGRCVKALGFTEKPDINTAREFVLSGNYLWNSGIFVWKTSVILHEYKKHLPEVYELSERICEAESYKECAALYSLMPCVAVDFGILEKLEELYVVRSNFSWDDIGSWGAFEKLCREDKNGNSLFGSSNTVDSKNCTVISRNSNTHLVGLSDICVINTGHDVLVFPKEKPVPPQILSQFLK